VLHTVCTFSVVSSQQMGLRTVADCLQYILLMNVIHLYSTYLLCMKLSFPDLWKGFEPSHKDCKI